MSDPGLAFRLEDDSKLLLGIAAYKGTQVGDTAKQLAAISGRMAGIASLLRIKADVITDDGGGEMPLADSLYRLEGRTITHIDASCCNNVVLHFADGGKVALHIDVDGHGLPSVDTCVSCA